MEENNTVDTQTTETTTVATPNNEGLLTQEQFDNALNTKVARVKNNIAKDLGMESYSKEAFDGYIAKNKEAQTTITNLQATETTLQNTILGKDFHLEALGLDVKPENVARAVKLAQVELDGNSELTAKTSLELVLNDFPFLATGEIVAPVTKVGATVNNTVNAKTEQEDYMNRNYSKSKYFDKK
jgi:hypothetical protein